MDDRSMERLEAEIRRMEKQIDSKLDKLEVDISRLTGSRKDSDLGQRAGSRFFWGIILIVVGILWMADKFDWFEIPFRFWPVALVVVGLYLLLVRKK